jgi:hypothetical protein
MPYRGFPLVIAWAWLEEIPSASALLVECSRLAALCPQEGA